VIVHTFEGLQALSGPTPAWSVPGSSLHLYDRHQTYAEIYRTQPNVRICVDFLARNIGEPSLHVFRRLSHTDRARLIDHDLATWLGKPNPATCSYRLIEGLIGDLGQASANMKVLSIAPLLREAIRRIHVGESVSVLFHL
jgi:hypothetical protein